MATRAHGMCVARDPNTGATLTSATVNVYAPGTVNNITATIFDKNGNALSNPLTSDATTGLIDFYLNVAQEVDLVVAKTGYTTRTYSNVPVIDDASWNLSALLTTTGDMPYASSANTPARLAIGAANAVMTVSGGVPAWTTTPTLTAVISATANPASAGVIRFANLDAAEWRNAANNANISFGIDGANRFFFGATGEATATAASATAGANGAPPAQVATYLTVLINGTIQKIPAYNN